MKINDFFKNNKIAVIAGSVVLTAAIISGVAFGVVNHKNKVESKDFTPKGSSVSTGSDKDVPPIENSSEADTSSEASASSDTASSTIETLPAPNNNGSETTSTSSKKPAASTNKPSGSASTTQPSTSTPSTPTTPTAPSTDKWTCPDSSAHPEKSASACIGESIHNDYVIQHQTKLEEEANPNKRNPEDVGKKCWICNRPFGDGYNGTCLNYFCGDSYKCHHYDTGDTCQIHH